MVKKTTTKKTVKKTSLNSSLFSYVEKENAKHAKTKGKEKFGSHSAYVNHLIAKDRGVAAKSGHWKAK